MKAHLKDSSDPIRQGLNVTANCGKEIPNAYFVFIWDDAGLDVTVFDQPASLRGICKDCKIPWETRMRYGILPGQEALSSDEVPE